MSCPTRALLRFLSLFPLPIAAGCANAPAHWAVSLEEELKCGMSIADVEALAGARLAPMAGRGPGGTHNIRHLSTALWFDFSADGLVSVRPSWTVALARDEWGEKRMLCENN